MAILVGLGCLFLVAGAAAWIGLHGLQRTLANIREAKTRTVKELTEMAAGTARTSGTGKFRLYCEVNGTGGCVEPVRSKIKSEPCLYYETTVSREYEERDDRGDTRTRTETVFVDRRHAAFWLEDGTGRIAVDPTGGEVGMIKVAEHYVRRADISGGFTIGGFTYALRGPMDENTLGYWTAERILPAGRRLYVLGEVTNAGGELNVSAPAARDRSFLISLKTEEALADETAAKAKLAKVAATVFTALGAASVLGGVVLRLLFGV